MSTDLVQLGLSSPERLTSLKLGEWDLLVRQARRLDILGTLAVSLETRSLLHQVPPAPRAHLTAARHAARHHERVVRWEAYCIERALAGVDTDVVLLKGAAYVMAGLPLADGRVQSDVDILVERSKLREVEAALLAHGWESVKTDEYDQRYYRDWSHELPPLFHPDRGTYIDVHHNILPETNRLRPSSAALLRAAQAIPDSRFKRLCDADMLLHVAAHMFQDGFLDRGLRELSDIDGLLRTFGARAEFWDELVQRAPEMDLQRPLFYALRYASLHLGSSVPQRVLGASQSWRPPSPLLVAMDAVVSKALLPRPLTHSSVRASSSRWLLYMRSHWLRMPPAMLARHLTHQAVRRLFTN